MRENEEVSGAWGQGPARSTFSPRQKIIITLKFRPTHSGDLLPKL